MYDEDDNKVTDKEKKELIGQYNAEQKQHYLHNQKQKCEKLARYSLDADNKRMYQARAEKLKSNLVNNDEGILENTGKSGTIEMYRKGSTHRKTSEKGKKIIDKATYNKITKPAIKNGAVIRIAEGEYLEHIRKHGTAVTIGDVIYFTPEATVSDVLEEVHHFNQNRLGLNAQYSSKQREIMNEIDAKEYLLRVTEKYKIPIEEVEETKEHLKSYTKQMEEMKERGEWDD